MKRYNTRFFRIADNRPTRELWAQLPTFTQYGRVEASKPGAQYGQSIRPTTGRAAADLMASQRYARLVGVLCIQNFWRWRLAKESSAGNSTGFAAAVPVPWRAWRRRLDSPGRPGIASQMDVQVVGENSPTPRMLTEKPAVFLFGSRRPEKCFARRNRGAGPLRPVSLKFRR